MPEAYERAPNDPQAFPIDRAPDGLIKPHPGNIAIDVPLAGANPIALDIGWYT